MGGDNPSAAKLPVDPRSTYCKLYLLRVDFSSFHPLLHLSPMTNKQNQQKCGGSALRPVFSTSRGSRCLEGGARGGCGKVGTRDLHGQPQCLELLVAAWKENPESCCNFLFLGRRHWRPRSWEQSARERAKERGGRHKALSRVSRLFLVLAHRMHHKAEKHPFVCLFWSPAPLRCPWWMVIRARTGCSQQKLRGCGAAGHCCQPRFPSPPPLVSEACVSEEGIHIHMEMPGLPPPRLLPPPGPEAGNQDTDASTLLAQGTPLLPEPRGISRLRRSPKAPLHPPRTRQGWKERGQAACPVTLSQQPH